MTAGRPPRVLIDATSVPADRGGVGRYVDGLLGALGKVCGSASTWPWSACAPIWSATPGCCPARRSSPRRPPSRTARPGSPGSRPACRCSPSRSAREVLHSPFYTCPLRAGCPVTVTVHDATFFTEPEHYDKSRRTFFRSAIKTSLRRADRVIVPSKATRDELIRLLDADPTRIDVAYHGVDQAAFHAPERGGEGPGTGPARPGRAAATSRSSGPRSRARTCRT